MDKGVRPTAAPMHAERCPGRCASKRISMISSARAAMLCGPNPFGCSCLGNNVYLAPCDVRVSCGGCGVI